MSRAAADVRRADLPTPSSPPESFPLSHREIGFIIGFWLLYGVLMLASRIFDTGGPEPRWSWGIVVVALVESSAWAALTPVVFWLAGRWGTETTPRRLKVPAFVLIGIAAAVVLGLGGRELRTALVPPPPGAPFRHGGPPLWFAFLNALIIYLGVLAAGLARAYSLRYRARREQAAELQAQLAQAHLEALRRQLDPHFLFNTLNAVSSLVERDPRGVRRMIARLSELLRHSLEAQDGPEIPLRKELELLGRYLDIMQVRFQGRLEVRQRVAEGVENALVPTMVLQPLVENAIRHGIEKLDVGGRISLEAAPEDDMLVLRVRDNGPDASLPGTAVGGDGRGVGLRNTMARLEQLYGTHQRFTLRPGEDGEGMVAELRIPLRWTDAA